MRAGFVLLLQDPILTEQYFVCQVHRYNTFVTF